MGSSADRLPTNAGTNPNIRVSWGRTMAVLVATLVVVAVVALPATADTVTNSITVSTPAMFEWHGSTDVGYIVKPQGKVADGEAGCNATTASPMTLTVKPPSGLRVDPISDSTSRTFTGCDVPQAITYSATAPGRYELFPADFTYLDTGVGTYDLSKIGHSVFAYELESYLPGDPKDPNTSCTSTEPPASPVDTFVTPVCVRVYPIPNTLGSVVFELTPPGGSGAAMQSFTVEVAAARAAVRDFKPPVCGTWTTDLYDLAHNKLGTDTFAVTDCDAGPTVTVPNDVTVDTNDPSGAVVTFADPKATDVFDGEMTPTCSATSGAKFPVGTTTVTCSATDFHGNTGAASFKVTVDLYQAAFSAPIDGPSVSNVAKAGRVIPVNVVVSKNGESNMEGPVSISVNELPACEPNKEPDALERYAAPGSTNEGNSFRPVDGGWIYNLDTGTPRFSPGHCYVARVSLGGSANADGKITGGHLAGTFLIRLTR